MHLCLSMFLNFCALCLRGALWHTDWENQSYNAATSGYSCKSDRASGNFPVLKLKWLVQCPTPKAAQWGTAPSPEHYRDHP